MNRAKYIVRVVIFLLAVVLLFYINKKTDDHVGTIAEFKFKMYEKLQADSLGSKQKLDLLVNETTKFVDDSSQVRKGIHYLIGMLGLLVVSELSFIVLKKRNSGQPPVD